MENTVSKKDMVLAILKARYNNPKNPENLGDYKTLINKKREDLESQYEPALAIIARETPRWEREAFLGHRDTDVIICQCGNRTTQGKLFKDATGSSAINYRTEAISCPKCHLQTLRYQRRAEARLEDYIEELEHNIQRHEKNEKAFSEEFVKDPWSRFEWSFGMFEEVGKHWATLRILEGLKLVRDGKTTLAAVVDYNIEEVLRRSHCPPHSTSPTSNLMEESQTKGLSELTERIRSMSTYFSTLPVTEQLPPPQPEAIAAGKES